MFEEQAWIFDLQFHAGLDLDGDEPGTEDLDSTPPEEGTTPTEEEGDQPQGGGESFTDIDPSKLPPELQTHYKNMLADYTRKTQEIAPIRKLAKESGMTPEQMVTSLQHYQQLNQMTPQELFTALVQRMGPKEARQIVNRISGDDQTSGKPEKIQSEQQYQKIENPFKDDEYAAAIFDKALAAATTVAEQRALEQFKQTFGKDIEDFKRFKTETQTTMFRSEVEKAIGGILSQYKDSGVTREQLFNIASKNGYGPNQMFQAWTQAIGGPEKVQEYFGKRYNAQLQEKAKKNAQIRTPLGGGKPPGKNKNWGDADWDEIDRSVLEEITAAQNA